MVSRFDNQDIDMDEIISENPNDKAKGVLWVGNYHSAQNLELLKQNQIRYVVTCMSIDTCKELTTILKQNHIVQKIFESEDNEECNLQKHFEDSYEFINKNLKFGNVLIHCFMGVSRAGAIATAYLIKKYKITYDNAL